MGLIHAQIYTHTRTHAHTHTHTHKQTCMHTHTHTHKTNKEKIVPISFKINRKNNKSVRLVKTDCTADQQKKCEKAAIEL